MESQLDWHNARALLEWQVDLGATEAIQEQPVDRFALDPTPVKAPKNDAKRCKTARCATSASH